MELGVNVPLDGKINYKPWGGKGDDRDTTKTMGDCEAAENNNIDEKALKKTLRKPL